MPRLRYLVLLVLIGLLGAGYWLYQRPLPTVQAEVIAPLLTPGEAIILPWPAYGQAAFGAVGFGVLEKNNTSKPVPIASIAKAVTALAILKEKPLEGGQQGPLITVTEADAQLYRDYLAKDGSVIPVSVGQQITQYQALQAMMLPSANNIADTTAAWAFGSVNKYIDFANQFVKTLGLKQTQVADASGFSPKTVSTAEDLVLLGEALLKDQTLAEIVNQSSANFPGVGVINNVNWLLGADGILGIKTGNTDEAGGCYLFGAKRTIDGQSVTVIGAVLGAPERNIAMQDSRTLILAADEGFELVTVVKTGQVLGRYGLPWGGSAEAIAVKELEVLNWKSKNLAIDTDLDGLAVPISKNSEVGSVIVGSGESARLVSVVLNQAASPPSWNWRIFR